MRLTKLFFAVAVVIYTSCREDDAADMMVCPAPDMPVELPDCMLSEIETLRPADDTTVTYSVDLYRDGEAYYYALLSSRIMDPILIYDACCELECTLGVFGGGCELLDRAEDLDRIWEE